MRRVAMVGAGMTQFGELFGLGIKDMLPMAVGEAADSVAKGFDRAAIEAVGHARSLGINFFDTAQACGCGQVTETRAGRC